MEEKKQQHHLIPMVKEQLTIPPIAAGIATGKGMLAAMVLGADGVQVEAVCCFRNHQLS
jgi:NAD(P)H-dependent flavin oxidoreductase YrpB (nitropropane dioxygenase family)